MDYDVFISCKSEDYIFAEEIYNFLKNNDINAFLASTELRQIGESEYRKAISKAMKTTTHLIVFASKAEYIDSTWVYYEWDMFVNAKLKGRKDGQIVTILKDVTVEDINMDLWKYESFTFDNYKNGLLPYVETAKSRERKEQSLRLRQSQLEAQKIDEAKKQELERKKKDLVRLAEDYYQKQSNLQSIEGKKILHILKEIGVTDRACPVCRERIPLSSPFCTNCGWLFSPIQGIPEVGYLMDFEEHLNLCKKLYKKRTDSKQVPSNSEPIISPIQGTILEKNESKLTFTVNGVSFTMVKVAGGTFTMGATAEQEYDARDSERPTHQVTLSDYYIGQTEVTQALWEAVMGESVTQIANREGWSTQGVGADYPMYYISYVDCTTFVNKLNTLLSSQLGGKRFALPTEAQWEFAARGGNKSKGYKYAGSNNLDEVAWYRDNSGGETYPVAQKQPNELGLYDMSGNVLEWCKDWKGSYSSNAQTNPQGPADGTGRVIRGGSWNNSARNCRVSFRFYGMLADRVFYLGLRLCLLP